MIKKFKFFKLTESSEIESQGKLDLTDAIFFDKSKKLNNYLTIYYIVNNNRKAYYDIIIVDNDMNIIFGESIEDNKFKYRIPTFRIPLEKTFEIVDNKSSKKGLVDETGKNIIVEPIFLNCRVYDKYYYFYNGEYDNYDLLTIVSFNGTIITKDNTEIKYLNLHSEIDESRQNYALYATFKLNGSNKKYTYKVKNIVDFFNTDWRLELDTKKFNL